MTEELKSENQQFVFPLASDEAISDGLKRLFGEDDVEDSRQSRVSFVPGTGASAPPPPSFPSISLGALASGLEAAADQESSALAKSRGLLVASQLWQHQKDTERAFATALKSFETSPKLAVASLLLRKKARALGKDEILERCWESASRLASSEPARSHARLGLIDFLRKKGDHEGALKILDQGAREGCSDTALLLRRVVARMAQRSSLAGLKIPEGLGAALAVAGEFLGENFRVPTSSAEADPDDLQDLAPLLAARALSNGDTNLALSHLEGEHAGPDSPSSQAILELEASLRLTETGGNLRSLALLKQLVEISPSRKNLRAFARRAVECHDREGVRWLLEQSHCTSGVFELEELWFLSAVGGVKMEPPTVVLEGPSSPSSALLGSLGPGQKFADDTGNTSEQRLLAQVGAGLLRIGSDDPSTLPISELGEEAIHLLEERALCPEITAVLRLLNAQFKKDELNTALSVGRLSEVFAAHSGRLIAATLLSRAAHSEAALKEYSAASGADRDVAFAAIRGISELDSSRVPELLTELQTEVQTPALNFALAVERACLENGSERKLELIFEATRTLSKSLTEANPALEALSSTLCAILPQGTENKELQFERTRLASLDSPLGRRARVRHLWTSVEHSTPRGAGLAELSESSDISERVLVYWGEAHPDRTTLRPNAPRSGHSHSAMSGEPTAVETLLNMVQSACGDHPERVGKFSPACQYLDEAIEAFVGDVGEIDGNTSPQSTYWLNYSQANEGSEGQLYAYERLAELDERRGDISSSLLWQRTLGDKFPTHLPSLLRLEESLLRRGGRERVYLSQLASTLPPNDRFSYELVAGALAIAKSDFRGAKKHLFPLLDVGDPPPLLLRSLATVFRERRDDEELARCSALIANRARSDIDRASTALSTALIYVRLGKIAAAEEWIERAIAAKGEYFSAHQLRDYIHQDSESRQRAQEKEGFSECVASVEHRAQLWFETADAWFSAGNPERAGHALERVLVAAPGDAEAFRMLRAHRESAGDAAGVEELINARLGHVLLGSAEQVDLETHVASTLAARGEWREAKLHLEQALLGHPENPDLLRRHAKISSKIGDHESAERSLVALRDRVPKGVERAGVVRALGRIYHHHLHQLELAMNAYEAVVTEIPDDEETRKSLVDVYAQLNLAERATTLQTQLIKEATTAEEKRACALVLADLYERVAHDPKRAEATLERVRKAWPLDGAVLEATIQFMDRQGTNHSRSFLLDRARRDALRKLEEGRMEGALLDTLARVAKLSGQHTAAQTISSARAAFLGLSEEPLSGAGLKVLDERLDELVAPAGLPKSLRDVLRKTGPAMDAAFSVDLSNMGAQRLQGGTTYERLQFFAAELGVTPPELFISGNLGARCLPLTTQPPRLLLGAPVEELPEKQRDYLLLRALKLRHMGVGALARSKDDDRWPMLVALLQLFSPHFQPTSVEHRKVTQAKALIEQGLARVGYDDDVPMLALEAIGAIGNQEGGFANMARMLANRTALLGVGDLSTTLSAIAAGEGKTLAPGGPPRFRWLEAHPEAKDLVLFSTTEQCARAREYLGLGVTFPLDADPDPNGERTETSSGPDRVRPEPPRRH